MITDKEGYRLINGGRKASLEDILMYVTKIIEVKSLTAEEKLESIKKHIERDLQEL